MPPSLSSIAASAAPWWMALLCSVAIAWIAWRYGSLRTDGAVVACVVGVLALSVQWAWGAFIVGWFVSASALSRMGRSHKISRMRDVVAKDGRRDARQVLANGGVFALCALVALFATHWAANASVNPILTSAAIAGAGALVASGADTWATEIGSCLGKRPRDVRTWRTVEIGTSGAVTLAGSLGGIVGALVLSGLAIGTSLVATSMIWRLALSGVVGMTVDTIVGAWAQERRRCPECQQHTERPSHCRGARTECVGGVRGLDNDVVNLLCSLTGALTAWALA